jgi:hypothetical protein
MHPATVNDQTYPVNTLISPTKPTDKGEQTHYQYIDGRPSESVFATARCLVLIVHFIGGLPKSEISIRSRNKSNFGSSPQP